MESCCGDEEEVAAAWKSHLGYEGELWKRLLKYEEEVVKELALQKQLAEELEYRRRRVQWLVPQSLVQVEEPGEEER